MKLRPIPIDIDPANIYKDDQLNRKESVAFIINIIEKSSGPLVLAVNAPWGTGKTTVLRMVKAELEAGKFKCIEFNAWKGDYSSDPLVAMVARLDEEVSKNQIASSPHLAKMKRLASAVAKQGIIAAVKAGTLGVLDLKQEIEAVIADSAGAATIDLVDIAKQEAGCLERFRKELEKLVQDLEDDGYREKLVFFVDELDRCRPSFAIELLERVKHLFDIKSVVFVLGIDKSQLEVSISAIYGDNFNAKEYLRRFIDLDLSLPTTSTKQFVQHQFQRFGVTDVLSQRKVNDGQQVFDVFANLLISTGLSLRTQEQCIARLRVVLDQTPSDYLLFPVLVGALIVIRVLNESLFADIRSGKSSAKEVMSWLVSASSPGLWQSSTARAIESYMIATDPNQNRQTEYLNNLAAELNDTKTSNSRREYCEGVIGFSNKLINSIDPPSINYVLRKIDFAHNLK